MILLVQFRDDQAGWHELRCVYDGLKLSYSQYKIVNVLSSFVTKKTLERDFNSADAVVLGGSGELGWEVYENGGKSKIEIFRNVLKKLQEPLLKLVKKDKTPVLATCFGHQLLAHFLGSEVGLDKEQAETGVFSIHLTKEGKNNPIFNGLKRGFNAVVGHKGSIMELAKDKKIKVLAYSDRCKIQAFQYGKNTYSVQFHPELSFEDLLFRLSLYPSYGKVKFQRKKVLAPRVLENFIKIINKSK